MHKEIKISASPKNGCWPMSQPSRKPDKDINSHACAMSTMLLNTEQLQKWKPVIKGGKR